jgi:predicted amidophosphoribosyltransferase
VEQSHAGAAGRQLLGALFPGRCLLCGRWLSLSEDIFFPLCNLCRASLVPIGRERCAKCGMALVSESLTCTRCREAGFVFESNVALFPYSRGPQELIRKLKFEGRTRLAVLFADLAASAFCPEWQTYPVVPVPPRPGRRTPDPVGRVAACLEKRHGKTLRRLLVRTGGSQQKSLDLPRRRENLRGMIRLAPEKGRPGLPARVVLLDDIFTTGATLDACARVLRDAGCEQVYAITLAIEE